MTHDGIDRRDLLKTVALTGLTCCSGLCLAGPTPSAKPKGRRRFKVCVDRVLPTRLHELAMRKAIAENPTNKHGLKMAKGAKPTVVPPDPRRLQPQLAILWQKKWQNGRTLRVRFLDGDTTVRNRIQGWAHKWEAFANIKFQFVSSGDAEIRVSLKPDGTSWSNIGTDALSVAPTDPTMNFGWLTPDTADDEYSRVVLHEFGHALGAIHEHMRPDNGIPWNKPAVYDYYASLTPPWDKQMVDDNVFAVYDKSLLQYGILDKQSIMMYPIPKELTDGVYEVGWNRVLSDEDKRFIRVIYPA